MNKKFSLLNISISFLFLAAFFLLLSLFIITKNDSIYYSLLGIFICYLLFILFKLFITKKVYTLCFFYILLSFFFMYDRIVFTLLFPEKYNFLKITFPYTNTFSKEIGLKFVTISFISFFVFDLVYKYAKIPAFIFDKQKYCLCHKNLYSLLIKVGFSMMTVFIFPLIYKFYLQIQFIKQFPSYAVANFAYDGPGPVYPWWTKGAGTFFVIGYLLVIYSNPNIKQFLRASALYFIMMTINSLKGGRALLFCFILCIPLLLKKLYNKKINSVIFVFAALLCVIFAIFVGKFRSNSNFDIHAKNLIIDFLYEQGTTLGAPFIYLDNEKNFPYHNYPFIFSKLFNYFKKLLGISGNVKTDNSLSILTVYITSPSVYSMGGGLGDNFITEIFDCGKYLGVILWSSILGLIVKYIDKCKKISGLLLVFLFYVYQYTMFLPRNTFWGFIIEMKYVLFVIIFIMIINFLSKVMYCKTRENI